MIIVPGHPEGQPSELRGATFTGPVWADPVLPSTDGTAINNVFFPPGARTFWHRHEHGQVLHVLAGSGLILRLVLFLFSQLRQRLMNFLANFLPDFLMLGNIGVAVRLALLFERL